jgi:hypothetical protein
MYTTSLNTQKFYIIPTECLYILHVSQKNIEVLPAQPSTTGFYNRGGKCLLRGKTWTFKLDGLRFVLKWLICPFLFFVLQLVPISFLPIVI